MSNHHVLKIHPAPLADLMSGAKTAEVRRNDRDFQVGDTVRLMEVNPETGNWTGSADHVRTISHIQTGYGLPDGMCVLSYADTAQREALARVETERDGAREALIRIRSQNEMLRDKCSEYVAFIEKLMEQRDTAQAQLAEAVVMLHRYQELVSTIDMGSATAPMDWCSHFRNEVKRRTVELGAFLARHAQAEQQEAQGAQAGDERAAFEKWAKDRSWFDPRPSTKERDDSLFCYEEAITDHNWIAWQARAALATQPADGEPVYQWFDGKDWKDCASRRDCFHIQASGFAIRKVISTPPAAAHGDEAVRKDAERYRWIEPVFAGLFGIDSMDEYIDRAAMRAQAGEGGEV